jgi:hypothetical protein
MSARSLNDIITSWIDIDNDDIPDAVNRRSSASKSRLLQSVLNQLVAPPTLPVNRIKLAVIARELLSGLEPVLADLEAQAALKALIPHLYSSADPELIKSMILLASLLQSRISLNAVEAQEELLRSYRSCPSHLDSDVVSLCERLARRLEKVQSVFDRKVLYTSRQANRRSAFANVDLQKAASNLADDIAKDWHTDPWGWPEIEGLKTIRQDLVLDRLASSDAGYVVKLDVAKDANSTRPALVMNPVDRLAYQSLIDLISLELVGHLPSWVYGWRLDRNHPAKGCYADNSSEWHSFNAALANGRKEFRHVLRLDIRGFFGSISHGLLLPQLLRQCKSYQLFERIEQFINSWNITSGRSGLPQRFLPSSLLAQAYLRPLDEFLSRMLRLFRGRINVSRWMDDIWLFSNDRRMLDVSLKELASILDQLGLEFNSDKTKWLETNGPEFSLMVTASADEGGENDYASQSTIDERIQEILANAEEAPRALFGLLNSGTIDARQEALLSELEPKLGSFPHVADFLANAILISKRWNNHEEWYVKYLDSHISPTDWSVEAFAEMFPVRSAHPPEEVANAFAEKLKTGLQTTVLPLACHRLAVWRQAQAMDLFVDSANSLSTPFEFRSLALAALATGGNRDFVDECLSAHSDTSVLLDMIRRRDFAPF